MRLLALAALAVLTLGTAGADAQQRACRPVVPSDRAPSWSPDGRSVAFVRRGGGCTWTFGVYVAWFGGGLDQLARGGDAPAWSPDGSRLAFTVGRELRVVGADGSDERVLATGASRAEPDWSPSGDELLYGGDDGEIHVVDVESGADRIVAGGAEPVWAGTSGAILFVSTRSGSHQLWRLAADGSLGQETFEPGRSFSPASNGDGSAVTFARLHDDDRSELHYWSRGGRQHFPDRDKRGYTAVLSPDGRSLAWPSRGRCKRYGIHLHTPDAGPRYERRRTNGCEFRGTSGRDTLRGTPWTDVIDAGAGDDLVLTRDSYTDTVSCGAGRDRVVADRKDAIAGDCERVQRP